MSEYSNYQRCDDELVRNSRSFRSEAVECDEGDRSRISALVRSLFVNMYRENINDPAVRSLSIVPPSGFTESLVPGR